MRIEKIDYPTYSAFGAKCRYTGAKILSTAACCPPDSSPKNGICVPNEGMFMFHNGSGDSVNHFITVTKLRCIAMGFVWNTQSARCISESECLTESIRNFVSQTRECTKTVPTADGVTGTRVFACKTGYWDEKHGKCVSRTKCAFHAEYGATLENAKLCIGKDEWLMDFPLNYLALNFEAKTASKDEELSAPYAWKTCGTGMNIMGRVCKCP